MRTCAKLRHAAVQAGAGLGHKIHEADRSIAATALRIDVDLVSDDAVFKAIPDLRVRRPHPRLPKMNSPTSLASTSPTSA